MSDQESQLVVAPWVQGVSSSQSVVVRLAEKPCYLYLTPSELDELQKLSETPVSVNEYLASHLSGGKGLNFQQAVSLLTRLLNHGFLKNVSAETMKLIDDFVNRSYGQAESTARSLLQATRQIFDLPLLVFESSTVHGALRNIGRLIGSTIAISLYLIAFIGLAISSGMWFLPDQSAFLNLLDAPEVLVGKIFFSFSIAGSWLALSKMAALAGAGARFIGGSVRLTGLCVVRLSVDDQDALSLSKSTLFRYHVFSILSPWVWALVSLHTIQGDSATTLGGTFCFAFIVLGIISLCPLYRSPIVKIAEGFNATGQMLERVQSYLARKILANPMNRGEEVKSSSRTLEHWILGLVCLSMLWLYGTALLFSELLVKAIPDLIIHLQGYDRPLRLAAAVVLLVMLASFTLLPLLRLLMIPIQNVVAIANAPLKKAREGIFKFKTEGVSASDAVLAFLKSVPVLAHLSDDEMKSLIKNMGFESVVTGQDIITQGEWGDRFYILADGQCQVVIEKDGLEEVVDLLDPGDSFGEIALIEKVKRTATIRALRPCKVLVVRKDEFDRLFPAESTARTGLTNMLRLVKIVMESEGLSHLSPRQVRELVAHSETVTVTAGQVLIEEDTEGDACFLVEEGVLSVTSKGNAVAELGPGSLVGAIALIKKIERTATVTASVESTLLKIDKNTFLKMCMSNVFVALLVSDLADKQISEVNDGATRTA